MTLGEGSPQSRSKLTYASGRVRYDEDLADMRARKRAEIIERWLPAIVEEVLASHEIPTGIDQAGLDRQDMHRRVLEAGEEVLAPAESLLAPMVNAAVLAPAGNTVASMRNKWVRGTYSMMGVVFVIASATLVIMYRETLTLRQAVIGILLGLAAAVGSFMNSRRHYGRMRKPSGGVNIEVASVLVRWWETCRDEGVLPFVRRVLDGHLAPSTSRYSMDVTAKDAPGLRGTSELLYVVRTGSVAAFLSKAEQLPTGAIGLAGPRGVGKTSLIEYFAHRVMNNIDSRAVTVTVSAPVKYEPKDFVLHMFAAVCDAILRARDISRDRTVGLLSAPEEWMRWLLWRRRVRKSGIVSLARQHLENIHYLQTRTSAWSGKVPMPFKLEAGWSRSTQRERRPQTYPELVSALREFLGTFAAQESVSPAMIIAIDELDKIESADEAQQFLNEVKGIFGAPATQFVVSVSEDALASFEQRELRVRDAFDSAFHEIVRIDYLTLADTAELLSSRVLRLPEPFKWLVHCMSGGLPRDVVRTARAMVALATEPPPSLDDVCRVLVADDLRLKFHAFQLDCRGIGDTQEVTAFIRALRQLSDDVATLHRLVRTLRQKEELAALSRRAAAYVYYSVTLLEVFRRDRVDSEDKSTFELLARAKQSLAVHPRLAWQQVDEFREAWGLATEPVD